MLAMQGMENQLSREDALLRTVEQINALIDYVRLAGLSALNEYQKGTVLNFTTRQGPAPSPPLRGFQERREAASRSAHSRANLHMSASATSHLVATLEAQNILMRTADEEDRRSVRVTLSTNGNKCAHPARQGMLKAINKLTAQLTDEENERRIHTIEKVYRLAYPEEG